MTPFRKLLSYFARYKRTVIIGVVCVFMTNVVRLTAPLVLRHAVDDLASQISDSKLIEYAGLIVLIALTQGVFLFAQRRLLINMSRDIEYDLRNDFYEHLQKLPFEFYQTHRTGDLMARATNDLSAVRMIVGPALMYSMNTVFAMALIVPLMGSVSSRCRWWRRPLTISRSEYTTASRRFRSISAPCPIARRNRLPVCA